MKSNGSVQIIILHYYIDRSTDQHLINHNIEKGNKQWIMQCGERRQSLLRPPNSLTHSLTQSVHCLIYR